MLAAKPETYSFFEDRRILITGGTGSLGRKLARMILGNTRRAVVVIFSRDEFKQHEMASEWRAAELDRLRFFLGDVSNIGRSWNYDKLNISGVMPKRLVMHDCTVVLATERLGKSMY